MASLPTRTTASFQAIQPIPSAAPLDAEFNQYVGAAGIFNGGTTATKLLVKTSDASDPPIDTDQTGAGPLARFKSSGSAIVTIANSGQIVSTVATGTAPLTIASTTKVANLNVDQVDGFDLTGNKSAFSISWFIADPSTFTVLDDSILPLFIVPENTGMVYTGIKILYTGGSHTSGGSVTFGHFLRSATGGGGTSLTSITLDNTNNSARFTYSASATGGLNAGDQVSMRITARSGTIAERNVTIALIGKQGFVS